MYRMLLEGGTLHFNKNESFDFRASSVETWGTRFLNKKRLCHWHSRLSILSILFISQLLELGR